jgi:subtilisin-like proprotein convertase family protein
MIDIVREDTVRVRPTLAAIALAAGCSFPGHGTTDGGGVPPDGGGADAAGVVGWSLRTVADFTDAGADPVGGAPSFVAAVAARDVVEPIAWQTRGLLGRATNSQLFLEETAPWSTVATAPANAATSIHAPFGQFIADAPPGLGVTAQAYTAWWEGEIFLDAGRNELTLDCDSQCFLEVDEGSTHRAQDDYSQLSTVAAPMPAAAGWYPIRVAFTNFSAPAWLFVFHRPPGATAAGLLLADRLRTRADTMTGVLRHGFDGAVLGDPRGITRIAGAVVGENYGDVFPADVAISDPDRWSQRLAGQVWIDTAGEYTFHVVSDDGFRIVVDGAVIGDPILFDASTHPDETLPPVTLARGWHDLAIDHREETVGAQLNVDLAQGPLTGTIPEALLRPVTTGRERIAGVHSASVIDVIPAAATLFVDVGRTAQAVELVVAYEIDHPSWQELRLTLTTPWGAQAVIRDGEQQSGNGRQVVSEVVALTEIPAHPSGGHPAAGLWRLDVDDVANSDQGTMYRWALTVRSTGGPAAFPDTALYTSGVHDFGAPRAVTGLVATASTPAGTTAQVSVRACGVLPCTGDFVASSGLPLPPARYAQVQVRFASDGIATPFVDDVDVYVAE